MKWEWLLLSGELGRQVKLGRDLVSELLDHCKTCPDDSGVAQVFASASLFAVLCIGLHIPKDKAKLIFDRMYDSYAAHIAKEESECLS